MMGVRLSQRLYSPHIDSHKDSVLDSKNMQPKLTIKYYVFVK